MQPPKNIPMLVALLQLISSVTALPRTVSLLSKRGEPKIVSNWMGPDADKVDAEFPWVMNFCAKIVNEEAAYIDPILTKYFNIADRRTVIAVFSSIYDAGQSRLSGFADLASIFVQNTDDGNVCTTPVAGQLPNAYMQDYTTDKPFIVMCPAGIQQGTLSGTTCDQLGQNVGTAMMTLAGTLLYEYTHWNKLLNFQLGAPVVDRANGARDCRALDKTLALTNADSYAWFASEYWWTSYCQEDFGDP